MGKFEFDEKIINRLIDEGLTTGEIIKYYGCCYSTFYYFLKINNIEYMNPNRSYKRKEFRNKMRISTKKQFKNGMPQSTKDKLRKINYGKYNLNINLNNSLELAYLMGALLGDGTISWFKDCGRIFFNSIDKILVEEIKNNLKKIGLNPSRVYELKQSRPNNKLQYGVLAYTTEFYRFYKSLNLLEFIENLNNKEILEFLRGLYETEGSVSIIHKNSVSLTLVINTENSILKNTYKILNRLGINYYTVKDKRIYKNRNNCFSIKMGGTSEEKFRFIKRLNPIIKTIKKVNENYIVG